jgi:phosphatidylglycerophosphate synthase
MLDRFVLSLSERPLAHLAKVFERLGISADAISLSGLIVGLASVPLIAQHHFYLALLAIALNRLFDAFDGAIARRRSPSDRGAFIDIAFDFFFYGAVPFGFALAAPGQNGLPAAFLLLSFIGTGSSFLALSALAQKRGLKSETYPAKGIYYLEGLAEGTETVACFVLMCLLPAQFPLFAWIFGAVCLLTTLLRWYRGWRLLSPP